jgi:hypothetical protein
MPQAMQVIQEKIYLLGPYWLQPQGPDAQGPDLPLPHHLPVLIIGHHHHTAHAEHLRLRLRYLLPGLLSSLSYQLPAATCWREPRAADI